MQTLDIFRCIGGSGRHSIWTESISRSTNPRQTASNVRQSLADFQMTQATLAEMATAMESSALLTYQAAWLRDVKGAITTREAAMAKMTATESAQQVIDAAVQISADWCQAWRNC